jgi:beta-glucanase (GH16 family)
LQCIWWHFSTMKNHFRELLCLFALMAVTGAAPVGQSLVWQENFDGTAVDRNTWNYEIGTGCPDVCGWGNAELEYYTDRSENSRIENGHLIIEARRENFEGNAFTSARMKTQGLVEFKYGTLEARIRFPQVGNGLWPAYWMLGSVGRWPQNGEIDIMEAGFAQFLRDGVAHRRIGAATHWDNNGQHAMDAKDFTSANDLTTDFHIYTLTWTPQTIAVSIDGEEFYTFDISNPNDRSLQEFHQSYFLMLNLAVGGNYPQIWDPSLITAPLPAKLQVDYIRLYQDSNGELYLKGQKVTSGTVPSTNNTSSPTQESQPQNLKQINIKGSNGLFVSTEDAPSNMPMTCNRGSGGADWEKLTYERVDGAGTFTLKRFDGKYCAVQADTTVVCNTSWMSAQTLFRWGSNSDGTFTIKCSNGQYLSSENGNGPMHCNRAIPDGWEKFTFVQL